MNTMLNGDEENEKYFCLEMKKLLNTHKPQVSVN